MASAGGDKGARKTTLYGELIKFSQSGDYDKAIKSANRLLHEYPDEVKAFESKIVCCIHVNKFQEALEFIGKNPKLSGNLGFEKAYCLYRLQQIPEAKQVLDQIKENSIKKTELLAQVLYRLERYDECVDSYKEVIKNSMDEYEEERQTNLSAIYAGVIQAGSKKPVHEIKGETYEALYNYACNLIAKDKIVEAEAILTKAEQIGTESLREEGLGDDEIEEELGIIKVQKAFCAQKLGRVKEAMSLYTRYLKNKPNDAGTIAVASNNVLSINRDQNIFESKKRIKTFHSEDCVHKLTRDQKRNMLLNECLFYLHTGQDQLCKSTCDKLLEDYPEATEEAVLVKIVHAMKSKGLAAANQEASKYLNRCPDSRTKIKLGLVQHALRHGNRATAIELLKDVGKDLYRPGIISSFVTLYRADGKSKHASQVIKDAVEFYKSSGKDERSMALLWRQAASLMMEQGENKEAVKSLEELRKVSPQDKVTLAQLIVAYSQFDTKKALELSSELPALPPAESLDMSALESPNWLSSIKSLKKGVASGDGQPGSGGTPQVSSSKNTSGPGTTVQSTKTKKKKRKNKHKKTPADYGPDRNPDPERWLPRYERSGFKPRKVRKGKPDVVGKGTQGASSEASAIFDMSGRAGGIIKGPGGDSPSVAGSRSNEGTGSSGGPVWRKDRRKKK